MKITAVKGFAVRVGIRNLFIVKVETDDGVYGIGECGISGRELAMHGMIKHFERIILGMDPRRIEHIWQVLYRSHYFEGGKIVGAAVSGIDIALWDLLGKSLGVPVYQLLGGSCRERITAFATPGALTGPEIVDRARESVNGGWTHLRFNLGMGDPGWKPIDGAIFEPMESIGLAASLLRMIRDEVGPGIQLAVDLHHRLSVTEAAHFCHQVADLNLMYVEEPTRAQSPAAYQQLRAMTPTPFAIGEEFSNKWEFAPFIEGGLLNFARIDVCNVGGLSEAKKVAGWCETRYIDVMSHNPLGPVCTAASIHLAASITNFAQQEYRPHHADAYPHDLFPMFPRLEGTSFSLPVEPGLGVDFDETLVEKYPFEFSKRHHFRRRDGAHTNW